MGWGWEAITDFLSVPIVFLPIPCARSLQENALESDHLGSNPGSTTYKLSDLVQVT